MPKVILVKQIYFANKKDKEKVLKFLKERNIRFSDDDKDDLMLSIGMSKEMWCEFYKKFVTALDILDGKICQHDEKG